MIKIKLSAGSKYISDKEAQAIESLQRLLSGENGYIIPAMFIGKKISNREIDAVLILPDAILLLDFKNWGGQRIEIEGINGRVRCLTNGLWEARENSLPKYQYAVKELATQLRREKRWLPICPPIYSVMVFTSIEITTSPQVSFAGRDPNNPQPEDGVGACRIEQFPRLLAAFRAANSTAMSLNSVQQSNLAKILLQEVKSPAQPVQRRIGGYVTIAEHHVDAFLNCKIYLGEGEITKEQVWIKEYEQVLPSPSQPGKRERLVLRHALILSNFPQHKNIVDYRTNVPTDQHLYVILSREPGVFLSELLSGKPLGPTMQADLQRFPFNLEARLRILGDLLKALEFLTQQPNFERSAYRDLRPDNIFVQFTDSTPIAQLFNLDCTKFPDTVTTKFSHLKKGLERSPDWEDYASPELLDYIESGQIRAGGQPRFTGNISSDIFSWAIIAWELLTDELPFPDTGAKLSGRRDLWPNHLTSQLRNEESTFSPQTIQLIEACLEVSPASRPRLATLRSHFR